MTLIAIVIIAMERFQLDPYVVDVLMPDLVGHDRRPATFVVYLYLLRQAARSRRDTVSVSIECPNRYTAWANSALIAGLTSV